jgi:hypothetical protein
VGVGVFLFAGGLLLLSGREQFLPGETLVVVAHHFAEEAAVGVGGAFHFHLAVVGFLLHGLVAPEYAKLGDSRFVDEYGPAGIVDELFDGCAGAFFFCDILVEQVVDVVADPDELLLAVANGND